MENLSLLFKNARAGNKPALAQILTLIEKGIDKHQLYEQLYRLSRQIYTVAFMGPAGVGKSSLLGHLILPFARYQHVGMIAIDPRSSRLGGAFLGDRLRLAHRIHHPRVFFRSFAPRLSPFSGFITASLMARAFEAAGYGSVIVETPGTGQHEWSFESLADTRILLLSPESGDEFQMMKRGLLESADIFVINKCDRPGAKSLETALQRETHETAHAGQWKRPIILTNALSGEGTDALFEMIEKHQQHLKKSAELEKRRSESFKAESLLWALTLVWQKTREKENAIKGKNAYEAGRKIIRELIRG